MIDIHSHILFNLDDGAKDEQMTINMLKIAVKEDIDTIVATPHYMVGATDYTIQDVEERYKRVSRLIKENNIPIKLLLGNEMYIDIKSPDLLAEGQCKTINGSRYVLIELPMDDVGDYTSYVIYQILLKGFIPIIAHPERYSKIKKHPNQLIEWIENGCLIQVNTSSLNGVFGKTAQQLSEDLIVHNMVHIVATDAHTDGKRAPYMKKAFHAVTKLVGTEKTRKLFITNGSAVINNEIIPYEQPIKIDTRKKSKFKFFKKLLANK